MPRQAMAVPNSSGTIYFLIDVEGASAFYGELFGWEFESNSEYGNFSLARHNGVPVAGLVRIDEARAESVPPQWVPNLLVGDVDEVAGHFTDSGKVLKGPDDMPDRGRIAVVEDPEGAPLLLLQTRNGVPEVRMVPMGGSSGLSYGRPTSPCPCLSIRRPSGSPGSPDPMVWIRTTGFSVRVIGGWPGCWKSPMIVSARIGFRIFPWPIRLRLCVRRSPSVVESSSRLMKPRDGLPR